MEKKWWKEAIVYQIYPRSFKDSNGDGIGDIKGIIEKLDYIKSLGIDVIWLNPVYSSPNDDNGYDISDYKNIMEEFGTMEDIDNLISELHNRGIKLIMDLVINHTSDEHEWFVESMKSKDNPYRDYYIWREGKNGKEPTNWLSIFSGSAWEKDKKTDEYFLHLFSKRQPDLNWENEKVRSEIKDMINWWLDKGIDGFRLDAINLISKDQSYPDAQIIDKNGYGFGWDYYMNGPKFIDYMTEIKEECFDKYDIMTVGECAMIPPEELYKYVAPKTGIFNMTFSFDHMFIDLDSDGSRFSHRDWNLVEFKEIFEKGHKSTFKKGWGTSYLANHDFPRMVSKYGDDKEYRVESSKMLNTLLFTMPGTVYVYQGDEIGMTNVKYDSINDYRDVEIWNYYREEIEKGRSEAEILKQIREKNRDNSRTPIQWDNTENAGFTTGEPWIKVNKNYTEINVEKEESDENSALNFFRKLTKLRKENKTFVYGDFKLVDKGNSHIFAYTRLDEEGEFLVVLNFSEKERDISHIVEGYDKLLLEISNYEHEILETIRPYESRVYRLI